MASVSIQARIDGEVWEEMKEKGETNTQLLQRLAAHYLATSGDDLKMVAPTPTAAVAVLLHSHQLLGQLASSNAISNTQPVADLPKQEQPKQEQTAAQCADDW